MYVPYNTFAFRLAPQLFNGVLGARIPKIRRFYPYVDRIPVRYPGGDAPCSVYDAVRRVRKIMAEFCVRCHTTRYRAGYVIGGSGRPVRLFFKDIRVRLYAFLVLTPPVPHLIGWCRRKPSHGGLNTRISGARTVRPLMVMPLSSAGSRMRAAGCLRRHRRVYRRLHHHRIICS